ncbi:MAG: dihydrofolate reductase family protein [Bacteroidota bacterium]
MEEYLNDLKEFDTVIMGRKTYEFGYQYGLKPGQPAYPHMDHHIISNSLKFDNPSDQVSIHKPSVQHIHDLKAEKGSDIYLCGGGVFAGWLLAYGLIDRLKIKLNPFIAGGGTPMFVHEGDPTAYQLSQISSHGYDHGLQIVEYQLDYN